MPPPSGVTIEQINILLTTETKITIAARHMNLYK
jgi:hypothetical protein